MSDELISILISLLLRSFPWAGATYPIGRPE
jgi:hypothetical protein